MNSTLNWTPGDAAAEQVGRATRFVGSLLTKAASVFSRNDADERGLVELGSLSERELNDIGLTRWDVLDAFALAAEESVGRRAMTPPHRLRRLEVWPRMVITGPRARGHGLPGW